MRSEVEKQEAFQAEMNTPLTGIDRLRMWLADPETFDPISIEDAEAIIEEIERMSTELEGVYDCLNDWSAFGFDPATNHLHADDGGAPAHCLLYVPKEI